MCIFAKNLATVFMAKIENPFRFGSVVTDSSFIDRQDKIKFVLDVMESGNHLVLIAPRRYGKTSLALKATEGIKRPVININLQNVTDEADFARQLIKGTLHHYPLKKIKYAFTHFAVVPTISSDPTSGSIEVSLAPTVRGDIALGDAFGLVEEAGKSGPKPIIIFDEFQDAEDIAPNMLKKLRGIMQLQSHVNYMLLGSQESMMREIFEKKKSPFYHFGTLLHLPGIPEDEFMGYLQSGFALCYKGETSEISKQILEFTKCHPYYTQELSFYVWNELKEYAQAPADLVEKVIQSAVSRKDYDYERLWARLSNNNKKMLKALASGLTSSIYTKEFLLATGINAASTVRGCVKRLLKDGFIINDETRKEYRVEDPFFQQWLKNLF